MPRNAAATTVPVRLWPLLLCALVVPLAAGAQTVETTAYTYNADGALTSITTQVDDEEPTRRYVTWDNFVPDADDPTTGTVLPGNGRVVAIGPAPGVDTASRQFDYDPIDRLIEYRDAQRTVDYTFHATRELGSSTLDTGDALRFYHDHGEDPGIVSIERASSGRVESTFGSMRTFTDGGTQILLSPRKDVTGVYDPETSEVTSYRYGPFGDEEGESGSASGTYDLDENPRRYSGEYRDPTWGGYYLRQRWYSPDLHSFLSRDPAPSLNRFGYTAGDPINRVDPNGRRYKAYKKAMRPLSKFLGDLQTGKSAVPSRLFLGPLIAPLALIADPAGFYHQQNHNYGLGWEMMLGTIALEGAVDFAPLGQNYVENFAFRIFTDVTSGTVNSVAGSFSHNFHRYTTKTFFDGLEFTAGGILEGRLMAGRGFRPFKYDFHDVVYGGPMPESLSALEGNRPSSKIFKVFRVSERLKSAEGNAGYHPIGDMLNLSLHHELLLAVSENGTALISEVGEEGVKSYELSGRKFGEGFRSRFNKPETKFEFQGYAKRSHVSMLFRKNPLELERAPIDGMNYSRSVRNPKPYSVFTRNCQMHVRAVLTKMNFLEP